MGETLDTTAYKIDFYFYMKIIDMDSMELNTDLSKDTELSLDKYMSCRSKFNGVSCVHLAEYFIAGKSLCCVHYMVFVARLFKQNHDKFIIMSLDDIKKRECVEKYILVLKDMLVEDIRLPVEVNVFQEAIKFKLNYISYGIESYIYDGNLIKIYKDYSKKGDMRLFKKMDINLHSSIENNRAKKMLHPHIPSFVCGKYIPGDMNGYHIYIYKGVTEPFYKHIRYLTRKEINCLFIKLSETVSKFHKKSIILGDISYANVAMNNKDIVITSFYSNTEECDMYGRLGYETKSNIMCADLITASLDSLHMKTLTKYSDLESIMWFYMQAIKHPLLTEIETGESRGDSIFSINNIIKKKDKFVRLTVKQNSLLQISNEGAFDIKDEVKRFIYYFDSQN